MSSEGEWSQVRRKGGRLRSVAAPSTGNRAADTLADGLRPNPNPELSVDDIWKYHQDASKGWLASEWWTQLCQTFEPALTRSGCPAITKAVCLGPGPYEPSNGSPKARWTAHVQTAAFCFVVGLLRSRMGQDIKCVVQEPRFTQADKDFCAKLGLEVIESPDAFTLMDEETFLFGIHMEIDIYNQALRTLPAIYIGAGLEQWERVLAHHTTDQAQLEAFEKMEATYDKFTFPDLDFAFSSTIVYWKRGQN